MKKHLKNKMEKEVPNFFLKSNIKGKRQEELTSQTSILTYELDLPEVNKLAELIMLNLSSGTWVFLDGDLGVGKTYFVSALFKAMQINITAGSPTFPIINTIKINNTALDFTKIVHLDLYRIKSMPELLMLGLEMEFVVGTIGLFEWPYVIELEDWQKFFLISGCPKPELAIQLSINYLDDNTTKREYILQKIVL